VAGAAARPRLARLALEAHELGATEEGALAAALLGERAIRARWDLDRPGPAPTGASDLLELSWLFREVARARFAEGKVRALGLSPGALQAVERARRQIAGLLRRQRRSRPPGAAATSTSPTSAPNRPSPSPDDAILLATFAGFPDRVARRRAPTSGEVVLAGGGSARLSEESVVREAPLVVALDAEERRTRAGPGARPGAAGVTVRLASAVTQEMLLELAHDHLRYEEDVRWNAAAERVDAFERLLYDDLVVEETRAAGAAPERFSAVLHEAALARGARAFAPEGALDRLAGRIAFAARYAPGSDLEPPSEADVAEALRELCAGRRSFSELREAGLDAALVARLTGPQRALLERLAPDRIAIHAGRRVTIHYEAMAEQPWVESRLQDFFGMADGPRIAGGAAPLVLHLLAPNGRAVQVTTDLAGFWTRHYPALRRELMRRYPRHAWPEDPLHATPPSRRR
jgi:ATP-dependent helicase HrpB